MYKASDNLKAAKALIVDPNNWIKRCYEQDADGKQSGKPVCKFCTIGAYYRASLTHFGSAMDDHTWRVKWEDTAEHEELSANSSKFLRKAMQELNIFGYSGIAGYNDYADTTHADIINLYDKAIEIAEQEEK